MKKINFNELKNHFNEVIELHGFVDKVRDIIIKYQLKMLEI